MAFEKGIDRERSGDLRGGWAPDLFERILPNLNEKRAAAVSREIVDLKEYLSEKQGSSKRNISSELCTCERPSVSPFTPDADAMSNAINNTSIMGLPEELINGAF